MPNGIRNAFADIVPRLPAILSVVLLAGLAYWGQHSDWKIPQFEELWANSAGDAESAAPAGVKVIAEAGEFPSSDAARLARIEFPSAEAIKKAGLREEPVQVKSMVRYVSTTGMIDYAPGLYTRLASRVPGVVQRVEKEVGDHVKKGDVLALIDSKEVGQLKANFLQSLEQYRVRSNTLDRQTALIKEGATTQALLLAAEYSKREARIRLFNDQQALLNLGLPIRLAEAEKLSEDELARALRLLGLPPEVRKHFDPETMTANLIALTAPFDGQIVQRNTASGEVVETTQPKILFVIGNIRHLHIDLDVPPEDMAEVRVGQKVLFRPDGEATEDIEAVIWHISPEVDEKTRRVRIHSEVESNHGEKLRPNTFGTGRIVIRTHPDAVVVPAEAVQSHGNAAVVFVRRSETTFEARRVTPGLRDGHWVEVKGLSRGEQVVTTGSFELKSELLKDRIASGD